MSNRLGRQLEDGAACGRGGKKTGVKLNKKEEEHTRLQVVSTSCLAGNWLRVRRRQEGARAARASFENVPRKSSIKDALKHNPAVDFHNEMI